jgi:hypothetical protein
MSWLEGMIRHAEARHSFKRYLTMLSLRKAVQFVRRALERESAT